MARRDASLATALAYQEKDKRISVHSHPQADGIGALRNLGLEKCDCRFVLPQDADDVSVPNRMQIVIDAFRAAPGRCAIGGEAVVIDANGTETGYLRVPADARAGGAPQVFSTIPWCIRPPRSISRPFAVWGRPMARIS